MPSISAGAATRTRGHKLPLLITVIFEIVLLELIVGQYIVALKCALKPAPAPALIPHSPTIHSWIHTRAQNCTYTPSDNRTQTCIFSRIWSHTPYHNVCCICTRTRIRRYIFIRSSICVHTQDRTSTCIGPWISILLRYNWVCCGLSWGTGPKSSLSYMFIGKDWNLVIKEHAYTARSVQVCTEKDTVHSVNWERTMKCQV